MRVTRFESVKTYREVEAIELGVIPSERMVCLQMKIADVEFPTLVLLTNEDALCLAAHLAKAVNEVFRSQVNSPPADHAPNEGQGT